MNQSASLTPVQIVDPVQNLIDKYAHKTVLRLEPPAAIPIQVEIANERDLCCNFQGIFFIFHDLTGRKNKLSIDIPANLNKQITGLYCEAID
jgi:hypothetical protein